MRKGVTADAKKANVRQVGLFFVLGGRPFINGQPWAEVPSVAGFRTSALGHPEFWERLQEGGAVPSDMPYEDCARGRVNYEDASRKFNLLADTCIIRNKRLIGRIMARLRLPKNTRALTDSHYRCEKCLGKKTTSKQQERDWDV